MAYKQTYRLIINPISGVNRKGGVAEAVTERLGRLGISVEAVYTERSGHARALAAEAVEDNVGGVIVAGGDGTVNEAAASLVGSGIKMGIIPSGSGNGLARHLDIPLTLSQAISVIERGKTLYCDCGTVNGVDFFCTSGMGFDAAVSEHFASSIRRGKNEYIKSVVHCFGGYRPQMYHIKTDREEFDVKAMVVAVCNASQYGNNAYIAPGASVSDGLLDLTIILPGNPLQLLMDAADLFAGTIKDVKGRLVTIKTRHVAIDSEFDMPIHIDGDPIMMGNHLRYACVPRALRVFTPGEARIKALITPFSSAVRDMVRDAKIGVGLGD